MTTGADFSSTTSRRGRRLRLRRGGDESTDQAPEAPRSGAKRTVMQTIRQLPAYVRLLFGLLTDARVSAVDKVLVAGAVAYILVPLDFVPDVIPFLGQVDDVFLLMTALQRLISNAGRQVVLDHWTGDMEELADLNLKRVVAAASFFLPLGLRRKLRRIGRG